MKKVLGLLLLATTIGASVNAQKVKESAVPAVVKNSFAQKFAGAKEVKWEKENGKFEVNFEQNKNEMSAVFDASGVNEETEMEIKTSALPKQVTSYLAKNYNGAKVKEAAKITKANGEVNYEAEVKGMDIIFDAKGNFLKTVKE